MRDVRNSGKLHSPNSIRRLILHTGWIAPVVSSVVLPAHAAVSHACSIVWSDSSPILAVNGSSNVFSRTVTLTNTGPTPLTNINRTIIMEPPFTQGTTVIAAPPLPDPFEPGATHVTTVTQIVNLLPLTTGNLLFRFTFDETTCESRISVTNQSNT